MHVITMIRQNLAITGITILFAVMLVPQAPRRNDPRHHAKLLLGVLHYLLALVFAPRASGYRWAGQGLVATAWLLLACFSLRNVRDHAFPDETLASVAVDFITVWVRG